MSKISLIKLIQENIKGKKSPYGEFIRIDFTDSGQQIGYTNIRLKKGWNQLHIDILPEFQGKGYATKMIDYNLDQYDYIVFPEDRITNPSIHKIISKFQNDSKYEVFHTSFDETVISNKTKTKDEILNILK